MSAQVAASQFSPTGCGHTFVLRRPLSKVTAKKCAECAESVFAHAPGEVAEEDLATILDVCRDGRASAIPALGISVGGYAAALKVAAADPCAVVANAAGARLHDFLPRTRAPFDALRAAGRVLDLEWDDADGFVLEADALVAACRWVDARRSEGRVVVVSCAQGRSRSGALATAYGMFAGDLSRDAALAVVRAARPFVMPNPGFLARLRALEADLRAAGRGR